MSSDGIFKGVHVHVLPGHSITPSAACPNMQNLPRSECAAYAAKAAMHKQPITIECDFSWIEGCAPQIDACVAKKLQQEISERMQAYYTHPQSADSIVSYLF